MHYTIVRKDEERSAELSRDGDGRLVVESNGERVVLEVRHLPDGDVHLLLGDRSFDLSVALEGHEATCNLLGRVHDLEVYNDRQLRLRRLAEASRGSFEPDVRSPMAGKVIAVQVAVGEAVDEQTALVVVEAMKMENVIRAEQPGRVERIAVAAGQAVEAGQTLLELAPLAAE